MKKQLLLIKLGGSVVTYKDSNLPRARIKVLKRLSKELKKVWETGKYQIILVHGAGSFAHPPAKKYNLIEGIQTDEQKLGYALTSQKMIELNSIIVNCLINAFIPAVSLPPRAFIKLKSRKLQTLNTHIIESLLNLNLIPVLFGDPVLDTQQNSAILSGDTIISCLANKLNPSGIIFLSDVDGIFDSDPKKNPNAIKFNQINNHNLTQVFQGLSNNNPEDVTGEMQGKITEIKNNLRNRKVLLGSGLVKNRLISILDEASKGTMLYFSD